MDDIPYNFPVMEKAKKDREEALDIYKLKKKPRESEFLTMEETVLKEFWGDDYEYIRNRQEEL